MLLKEKRDSTIKGQGCDDGRRQRLYIAKEQTLSPRISNEALFLTLTIDTKEGRDVETCDIPGTFLQTDMPEGANKVHIKIDGEIVELLAKFSLQLYEKYIILSRKGKTSPLWGDTQGHLWHTERIITIFKEACQKSTRLGF